MATNEELVVHARLRDDLSRPLRAVEGQVEATARRVRSLTAAGRAAAGGKGLGGITVAGKTLSQRLNGLNTQVRSLSSSFGSTLATGVRRVGLAVGALTAAVGIFGIKASSQFQTSRIAFEALLGSAEKGNALFAELVAFNKKTPFELGDLAGSTQLLLRYGVEADKVVSVIKGISDAAALTLNPSENLQRASLAIGQIVSAGRVMGQDARQLTEAGITVYKFFAQQLGITQAEARKLGEAGELSADMLIEGLMRGDKALGIVAGGAEKLNKTLLGQFSNLKDAIAQTFDDTAGELNQSLTSAMPGIITAVTDVLRLVGPPVFDLLGQIAHLAQRALPVLAPLFAAIVDGVGRLLDAAAPAFDLLNPVVDDLVAAIGELVTELVPVMPDLVRGFVLLVGLLPDFVRLLGALVPLVTPLVNILDTLLGFGPTRGIILGVATAVLAFGPVSSIVGGVWSFVAALWGLVGAYRALGGAQAGVVPGAVPGMTGAGGLGMLGKAGAGLAGLGGLVGVAGSAVDANNNGLSLGNVLAGAGSGALAGGSIASIVPGLGTVVGIGGGALIGAGATILGGLFHKKHKTEAAPSSPAGAVTYETNLPPGAIVVYPQTEMELERSIAAGIRRYDRDRAERGGTPRS